MSVQSTVRTTLPTEVSQLGILSSRAGMFDHAPEKKTSVLCGTRGTKEGGGNRESLIHLLIVANIH